ncbi:RRP15-like protein [Phymastichus coffea]|uniref:RRP15-like protein n=1 Tax=Phymastichus coffea TaxID=108790 RepID=UPI00273B29CE|nr:RRP15-like protein [Phymastichus coffea]
MIALDSPSKLKKSPKKSVVQAPIVKTEGSDFDDQEDSDASEAGTDSPNEEMDIRENLSNEDQSSSGDDGDESDRNEEDEESNDAIDKSKANHGWANAMKKVLNTKKPKRKKSIVLSKAKKLNEVLSKTKEEVVPFEVEGKDGTIKKETIKKEEEGSTTSKESKKHKRKDLGIRVKPSVLDRERERRLQKIATNGVVQLFNAVRQQQNEIENKLIEAGPLERKQEKALKSIDRKAFLDVLMGGTNKLVEVGKGESKEEKQEDKVNDSSRKDNKIWSVLRDDFVMGAKLKDWNKHDTDEDSSAPEEMDSD